ncbi:MAG: hypothetical protein MZW92_55680 [Comamonadaceae bacterium]|nr:hypothetical protein [Comamonadaceae bacterium]
MLRRRRGAAELGHQGGAAGDAHRRRAGRPRRAARQARAGLRAAVRGLPAGQADAVDLMPSCRWPTIPPEQIA